MTNFIYTSAYAALATLAIQSGLVILNIEGEPSVAYAIACGATVGLVFSLHWLMRRRTWSAFWAYAIIGFVGGSIAGLFVLIVSGLLPPVNSLINADFFGWLAYTWCLEVALFGLTFSLLLWGLARSRRYSHWVR